MKSEDSNHQQEEKVTPPRTDGTDGAHQLLSSITTPRPESPRLGVTAGLLDSPSPSASPFYSPASPTTESPSIPAAVLPATSIKPSTTPPKGLTPAAGAAATAMVERWLNAPHVIDYAKEWKSGGNSRSNLAYAHPSLRAACLYFPKEKSESDWKAQTVDDFKKVDHIGEGTYGSVYRAKSPTGKDVALKKVRMEGEKDGFPVTSIRELTILRSLNHKNIVNLLDVVSSTGAELNRKSANFFMVFEYLDHDLTGLLDSKDVFLKDFQVKYYFREILEGLAYCHRNGVLHRDMKGSNVLISSNGDVKLADFGLARFAAKHNHGYSNRVITLWYRPPELLLGATHYSFEIDMWSVGCVFAEMLVHQSPFPGRSELDQFDQICQKCGTPTEESWPGVTKYPWYERFKPSKLYPRTLRNFYSRQPPEAQDLLDKLLVLDPKRRLTAEEALAHPYFTTEPLPERPILNCQPSHELQTKRRNKQLEATGREKISKRKHEVLQSQPFPLTYQQFPDQMKHEHSPEDRSAKKPRQTLTQPPHQQPTYSHPTSQSQARPSSEQSYYSDHKDPYYGASGTDRTYFEDRGHFRTRGVGASGSAPGAGRGGGYAGERSYGSQSAWNGPYKRRDGRGDRSSRSSRSSWRGRRGRGGSGRS